MLKNNENLQGNCSQKVPFFIVGSPRSGSTLLQTLIDSHSHIAIPPESHIFDRFLINLDGYGDLCRRSNLRHFVKDLLSDLRIKKWNLSVSVDQFCDQLKECTVKEIIALLFELYVRQEGKSRWGDKTPKHTFYLNRIKELFPDAKIIHLVRDGRDVAVSLGRMYFGPASIIGLALSWKQYISAFANFKTRVTSDAYLEVRYEDLVSDPSQTIGTICDFLEENRFSVSHHVPNSKVKEKYINIDPIHRSLNDPISTKKVGGFKKAFSRREIEIFESVAKDALVSYGYALETSADSHATFAERAKFFVKDQYYRFGRKLVHSEFIADDFQWRWRSLKRRLGLLKAV